jgi:hypothetical protein
LNSSICLEFQVLFRILNKSWNSDANIQVLWILESLTYSGIPGRFDRKSTKEYTVNRQNPAGIPELARDSRIPHVSKIIPVFAWNSKQILEF